MMLNANHDPNKYCNNIQEFNKLTLQNFAAKVAQGKFSKQKLYC